MSNKPPTTRTNHFRSKHIVDTATTALQDETEFECEPFFVCINSLPQDQILHLRQVGLLRHVPEKQAAEEEELDDGKATSKGNENTTITKIQLLRQKHSVFLSRPLYPKDLCPLPSSYISLDASKPWILYWTIHSLDLLSALPTTSDDSRLVRVLCTLESYWKDLREGGGFGGGPNQIPHCATSHAAVLCSTFLAGQADNYPKSSEMALELLQKKRKALQSWFFTLRCGCDSESSSIGERHIPSIGCRMHHDGEVDVRATYTICAMASLLNILTSSLTEGMVEYIVSCQTFEGGFGGVPFAEAHGGYTFCALAALHILTDGRLYDISGLDIEALRGWLTRRQMAYEGGFQGRCNKLVDGCYSYWIGGAIAILDLVSGKTKDEKDTTNFDSGVFVCGNDEPDDFNMLRSKNSGDTETLDGGLMFDQKFLQRYILLCGQDVNGGLRDKPSKPRDFYHSCYNLSGLSISQHVLSKKKTGLNIVQYEKENNNVVAATHPVYNIRLERVLSMLDNFHMR